MSIDLEAIKTELNRVSGRNHWTDLELRLEALIWNLMTEVERLQEALDAMTADRDDWWSSYLSVTEQP